MDSSLNFALKSLCFGKKNSGKNFYTSIFLKNISFRYLSEKVKILKKRFFLEPWDQKNGFPTQFTIKITLFRAKNFFIKFFKKLSKFMAVLVKKSEKVRVIGTKKSKF